MRTIKVELTIEVPSNYKIDEGMTDFAQVCDLLDEMEDRYSNVGLIDGRIIGGQNEGVVLETEDEPHWKPSEEQMSFLWSIYQGGEEQEPLRELIEQLKKL